MAEQFDPAEVAVADRLDAEIDAVLAGRASRQTDATVLWLATTARPPAPSALASSVARARRSVERRLWRPAQVAAAALAALFAAHGLSSLLNGAWVAENLGEAHSPHAYVEGGLALLAASIAVGAGLFRRERLGISVAAGAPLGLLFGVQGANEVGEFAWGVALHLSEALVALVLLVAWWRARRSAS